MRSVILFVLGAVTLDSAALQTVVPAGVTLSVRLRDRISSQHSQPGETVSATLIAPIRLDGRDLIPCGFLIQGAIENPGAGYKESNHSVLRLNFGSIVGNNNRSVAFHARVRTVDNGRESVDTNGVIHGLRPLRRRPTEIEDLLMLAAYAHPAVLASLEVGKLIVAEKEKPRINYGPGIEFALVLNSPLTISTALSPEITRPVALHTPRAELLGLVDRLPLRTATAHGASSDLINCVFLGSHEALVEAFTRAGWMPAESLDLKTEAATFLAVAGHHSYHEGPVSSLLLNGQKPDLVFEKAANTFAKRHHIRIWSQDVTYDGQPVWIGSGTHDIGINFSRKARTFSHSVDGNIDEERQKIIDDLTFTGAVTATSFVQRAGAPRSFRNATGDQLHTDGAIAAIRLASIAH